MPIVHLHSLPVKARYKRKRRRRRRREPAASKKRLAKRSEGKLIRRRAKLQDKKRSGRRRGLRSKRLRRRRKSRLKLPRRRRIGRTLRRPLLELSPPIGYTSTQDWLNQAKLTGYIPDPVYMEFHAGETATLSDSRSADGSVVFPGLQETIAPAYAGIIPNGRVWGADGAVLTPDNLLVADVSIDFSKSGYDNHPVFHQWQPHPVTYVPGTVACVTFCGSDNYFHWMYDVLTRFHLLRLSGIRIDKYIINHKGNLQFQYETLNLLGIPRERIIETHDRFHLKADRLVLTSIPAVRQYAKWSADFLRDELMLKYGLNNPNAGPKRIFVGRGNAGQRRPVNEAEVMNLLGPRGFHYYSLDDMSVRDQIQLFHSADIIVAPHGAALTNLTFCRPGTTVVELMNNNYAPGFYWRISNYQGLNYYCILCEGFARPGEDWAQPGALWIGGQDFVVDINKLDSTLKTAGV
ncbi:glycosyltransferase family 61 protein [Paenibacillus alkalitolerans]|uniref:glycosyltransferase family 61 protein n=1 Tax=Paenibacillus alkalitolerans TaxID=2799335 RepID=UPI0018F41360|nr:glycosyltransferase family 61 protein [Paenibacillus alkalitolerans]